jgi:hypothetical protein
MLPQYNKTRNTSGTHISFDGASILNSREDNPVSYELERKLTVQLQINAYKLSSHVSCHHNKKYG